MPDLSICIPTHYGRAATLRDALESIDAQLDASPAGAVEVCISTGGADDGTDALIAELSAQRPGWLRLHRSEVDAGFTHHLLDAVQMASGTYAWLFSSDDAIAPRGIETVRGTLLGAPDLVGLSCAAAMYDQDLAALVSDGPQFFFPSDSERPHRYAGAAEVTRALGVTFAYVAAHVVRRDAWAAGVVAHDRAGRPWSTYFPHMDVFGHMIRTGNPWGWTPVRVIRNRTGNDSWTPRRFGGDVSRYWVAILGDLARLYGELAGGRADVIRPLLETWVETVAGPQQITSYRLAPGGGWRRDARMLAGFTRALWRVPAFWRDTLPALLTPRSRLKTRLT